MKHRNITISGLPGGGSTTLLKLLREKLEFDGWRGFSGGEFMRAYALEKGLFKENAGLHHSAADYEEEFDRKIDMGMREKLQHEENWILESWLSGFMGQGVDGTLKVLVYCSDDAVRVDRIVNRDKVTADQALENMRKRTNANISKWTRMYAGEWKEWVVDSGKASSTERIWFWKPELYDIVIDTYSMNQEQTLQKVLENI